MKCRNLIYPFEEVRENPSITISTLFQYVAQKLQISYKELKFFDMIIIKLRGVILIITSIESVWNGLHLLVLDHTLLKN